MIEGIISKNDMVLMNKKYDAEIEAIQIEIRNIEEVNLVNSKQADNLQVYIDRIKAIVNEMNSNDMEEVYKRMVNKIVIHQDNILELFLTCMPTPIKIQYSCKGKNGYYEMKYKFINE
jgi:site-specific DNA recombinase